MKSIIAAFDPSIVKTGCVLLSIKHRRLRENEACVVPAGNVEVIHATTIRPGAKLPFSERIKLLNARMEAAVRVFHRWEQIYGASNLHAVDEWIIEDPRDFSGGPRRSNANRITLGAAFGVVTAAVASYVEPTLVSSQQWLPRRKGNVKMKHEVARAWLKVRWPALEPLTDDETFAAGMAIWFVSRGGAFL